MAPRPEQLLRTIRRLAPPPGAAPATDADLLDRFVRNRDEAAFAALVKRHAPMVLGVCRRALRDAQDAEDAAQATFLVLARKAASVRRPDALAAWLHGVARRLAVRCRRAGDRRRAREARAARTAPAPLPPGPLDELTARELLQVLDEELQRLPEVYRAPVLLCCLEGRTQDEAAAQLGWAPGSLKGRLERGRKRLHARLARRGLTLSAVLGARELSQAMASARPAGLKAEALLRGAAALASEKEGTAVAGVSAKALALAEGALEGMAMARAKLWVALFLAGGLFAAGGGATAYQALRGEQAGAGEANRAGPASEARQARTDLAGDPLPPGALLRLGTARFRHGDMVRELAFSPDGTTLVSADWHGAHVWVAASGKHLRRFGDPRGRQFQDIAFSPGGRTVALSMSEGEIDLWDAVTGRRLSTFRVGRFPSLELSPDGKALAVLDHDEKDRQRLRLLDAATGKERHRFAGHRDRTHQFVFSPDGKVLISAGDDRAIRFWDTATGKEVRRLDAGEPVLKIAVAPGGKALASVSATKSEHGNATMWMQGSEVVLWDLATGKETHRLKGHGQNGVSALAFSPDGRSLVSCDWHSTHWWDVATGREDIRRRWRAGRVTTLAFSADGRLLALGGSDNVVRLWEVTTGKEALPTGGHGSFVVAAAVSPDGRLLATGGGDGSVRLWDAATGRECRRLTWDAAGGDCLAFADGGRLLVSAGPTGKTVRVWEAATGKELRQSPGTSAVVSPDGKGLVTGDGRELRYVEAASGRELCRWPLPKEGAEPLAFSADGRGVFTVGTDRTVRLWDVASGKQLRQFSVPHFPEDSLDRIYCMAFSPAGDLAAFGGQSGVITLVNARTGAEVRRLTGPAEAVSALAFSADGRVLAAGDWRGGTVRLWEVATGRPFRELAGHEGRIHALTFSADGQTLLTGSDDTTALVWGLTGRRTPGPLPPPTAQELDTLWADLAADDARRGQQAVGVLVAAPRQALALLGQRLRPAARPDAERLARLFADLESDDFEVRERAATGLKKLGEAAEPALRRAFATTRSPEVRERVKPLLADLERSAEWVRTLRALQVVESLGTPEARRLLESLARGGAEARLTREAKASLLRLPRRPTPKP